MEDGVVDDVEGQDVSGRRVSTVSRHGPESDVPLRLRETVPPSFVDSREREHVRTSHPLKCRNLRGAGYLAAPVLGYVSPKRESRTPRPDSTCNMLGYPVSRSRTPTSTEVITKKEEGTK